LQIVLLNQRFFWRINALFQYLMKGVVRMDGYIHKRGVDWDLFLRLYLIGPTWNFVNPLDNLIHSVYLALQVKEISVFFNSLVISLGLDDWDHFEIFTLGLWLLEGWVVFIEDLIKEPSILGGLCFASPRVYTFLHFKFNYIIWLKWVKWL
jgi:hypothetical protein